MKRYGNLFKQIINKENLSIAFDKAAANKKWRDSVANAYKRKDEIINEIYLSLKNKTYKTSEYVTKTIYEPKERLIYILPFAPDRVVHHAVMNILEPEDRLGIVIPMSVLVNKPVVFLGSDLFTKKDTKYLRISYHLLNSNKKEPVLYVSFIKSEVLIKLFNKYKNKLPFDGMIIKINNWYSLVPTSWSNIMKGFPKHLNTKEDYLYIKEHFERDLWVPEFQKLLDTTSDWFFVKNLDKAEDGITDDTHKVVETEISSDEPTILSQYEFRENPDAKLYKLGFTVEEVQQLIA